MKRKKEPFNKESGKKVSFEDVVNLIGAPSEYHFAIIENGVDEELIDIARKAGIDITGYKHVIETSGTSHSQNSLFFNRLESEKPPKNRGLFFLLSQGVSCIACPLRLDNPLFFYPFLRPTVCKYTTILINRNKNRNYFSQKQVTGPIIPIGSKG